MDSMDGDLREALDVLREALMEHEQTWGPVESHTGDEDWATRAAALLSRHEVHN